MVNLHDCEICGYLPEQLFVDMAGVGILVLLVGYYDSEVELKGAAFVLLLVQDLHRETHVDQRWVKSQGGQLATEVLVWDKIE